MCIEMVAERANLEVIENKTISFNDFSFRYVRANRNVTSIEYHTISQYFLVELTEENAKVFCRKEGYASFKLFQHKLLSTTYFQAKSDLRWNIYLIFVEDDCSELSKECCTLDIENDESFARKYFFTRTDAVQFLSEEYFVRQSNNSLPINPISEWVEILDKVELTGSIYNEFSSAVVEKYIFNSEPYNGSDCSNISGTTDQNLEQYQFKHIKEVEIGKFRPHCFLTEEKFRPVLVNLLHGSNGSGKTSILESIEYAITDNIRRQKDFNDEINLPEICLIGANEQSEQLFKSRQVSRVYKEIDRAWYGSPVGRGNSTLNMNFNHFNCFNAESAYKFAIEESKSENKYIDTFTNLIFDSSLLTYQRNLLRYEREFTEKKTEINRKILNEDQKIIDIGKALESLTTSNFSSQDLDELLVNLKYIVNDQDLDLIAKYQRINTVLAAMQSISNNLKSNLIYLHLNNLEEVHKEKIQNRSNIEKLSALIKDRIDKQNEEGTKIEQARQLVIDLTRKTVENGNLVARLTSTLGDWLKYKLMVTNPIKVEELKKLKLRSQELFNQIDFLRKIDIQYPNIKQCSKVDIASTDLVKEIEEVGTHIKSKQEELSELTSKLEENNKKITRQRQIKVQLKAIATDLLESDHSDKCPLCGVSHDNYDALVANIEREFNSSADEELISKIEIKKNLLQQELEQLRQTLTTYETKRKNTKRIMDLATVLNNSYKIDLNADSLDILESVQAILLSCENLANEKDRVQKLILAYTQDGFSDEVIQSSDVFIKTNSFYGQYVQGTREDSFETYIAVLKQKIDKENIGNQSQVALAQASIGASQTLIESLNPKDLQANLESLRVKETLIDQIQDDYSRCSSYFNISTSDDIISFSKGVETAALKSEIIITQLQNLQSFKSKRTEMLTAEQTKEKLQKYLSRCSEACNAFGSLPKLNERVTNFIQGNKERIQLFFKALHTPREFVSLDIIENKIVVIREKDKKQIRMFQMSTGQRASLALAVIFTLYLSAESAPRFLLLDEPVANMDDLHLMNLMDILRVLALNGTQIIFTTANPIVAGIFRRKFSFFGNRFNHFELSRYNLEQAQIKIVKYSPNKEEGETLQPVS